MVGKILGFIKTHWMSLACAVVAVAAVAFAVIGMNDDAVQKRMSGKLQEVGASNIGSLRSNPKNQDIIDAEEQRGKLFDAEFTATVEEAKRINRREPLLAGVFPKPENDATPYQFRDVYQAAAEALPRRMDAGTLPTEYEIQEEVQNIVDMIELEREKESESKPDDPSSRQPAAPVAAPAAAPTFYPTGVGGRSRPGFEGRMPGGVMSYGGMGSPSIQGLNLTPEQQAQPKYNPHLRAQVAKAKSIRCYVDPGAIQTHAMVLTSEPPDPEQMWYAQVMQWVETDVADAIAALNAEAAKNVGDDEPSVENMPVKRVRAIEVLGYLLPSGQLQPFPNTGQPAPPVLPKTFTGRRANELYDVVRFNLSVVVDQRAINELIDAITRQNFCVCLNASYEGNVNQLMEDRAAGYLYGADPVVVANLQFEMYLLRDIYASLMPASVRQKLGIDASAE